MTKRVIIIHGWEGGPDKDWMPWANKELTKLGYQVIIPEMPDTNHPKIGPWVEKVAETVGKPDEDTILVGHSIGCQTILRYLQTLHKGQMFDKVIFIASWVSLTPLSLRTKEEREIVKPWYDTPIDFAKAKTHANSFTAVFSDNDQYVPLQENRKVVEKNLGARIIIEKGMGHFSEDAGVTKLPVLLKLI